VTAAGPRVGIIGLGYGRAHISAFQVNGCQVVALCQRDRTAARTVADRYGIPEVFAHWPDLLERARPDIVAIATPPHLHHAIALQALAEGAHVLCEKPLAMNAIEARAMVDAARRAGRVAMTAFNWRMPAALDELQARLRAGELGRVLAVTARWVTGRWAEESVAATWRMDRAQAGHGSMGDQGVHVIDIVRALFGEFARVVADAGVAYPQRAAPGAAGPANAEDHCGILARLTTGAHATLAVNRVAHGMNEHTLEVYGTRGAAHYRMRRVGPRWWDGELQVSDGGRPPTRVEPRNQPAVSAGEGEPFDAIGRTTIALIVARMLEGIRTGATPSPSFEDGARAQAVLDAVAESAARRVWVDVRN
jgi:predicted dehydrogenase